MQTVSDIIVPSRLAEPYYKILVYNIVNFTVRGKVLPSTDVAFIDFDML
jgi:hypothetical protein